MTDDSPHDGAPLEIPLVFSPVTEAEEPVIAEIDEAAGGIEANLEAEFELEVEPEPLPLRVHPFDPTTYHPRTHILPAGGIRRFSDFVLGVLEDLLLRETTSHVSSIAGESRAFRGYRAMTAQNWYDELLTRVCDIVDETGFGLFCSSLT
ncbi:hypothetical protein CsSME_00002207 [Camellia sinensis var. sinensis]